MAKIADLTVDVKVNVDLENAERALRVIEWFLNDNKDYHIIEGKRKYRDSETIILSLCK